MRSGAGDDQRRKRAEGMGLRWRREEERGEQAGWAKQGPGQKEEERAEQAFGPGMRKGDFSNF